MNQFIDKLTFEIEKIQQLISFYDEINQQVKQLECQQENKNEPIKKRLQKKEVHFDKMYEIYMRVNRIVDEEQKVHQLLDDFHLQTMLFFLQWKSKKELYGNKLNRLLSTMKELELESTTKISDRNDIFIKYQQDTIETDIIRLHKEESQHKSEEYQKQSHYQDNGMFELIDKHQIMFLHLFLFYKN